MHEYDKPQSNGMNLHNEAVMHKHLVISQKHDLSGYLTFFFLLQFCKQGHIKIQIMCTIYKEFLGGTLGLHSFSFLTQLFLCHYKHTISCSLANRIFAKQSSHFIDKCQAFFLFNF